MKKFTKTIAAISAAAMLTISSGMTASAYYVTKVNPDKLTNNGTKTTGFKWDTNELQYKLPVFSKTLLDKKSKFVFPAPINENINNQEYGRCHLLGLLDRSIVTSNTIENAKKYVDKISVKNKSGLNYCVWLEYQDNSFEDDIALEEAMGEEPEDIPDYSLLDYALTMHDEYDMKYFFYQKASIQNIKLDKSNFTYTGDIILRNVYVSGLSLSSSDNSTYFEQPVLEKDPSGLGFRTVIKFHETNPYYHNYLFFGHTNEKVSFHTLFNVTVSFNCGNKTSFNTNNFIKEVTINLDDCSEHNDFYTCLLTAPDVTTELTGKAKQDFQSGQFFAAKKEGSVLHICLGSSNTGISNPGWSSSDKGKQFEAMLSCGYADTLKRCTWFNNQLGSVTRVRFYRDASENNKGTFLAERTPSEVRSLIN